MLLGLAMKWLGNIKSKLGGKEASEKVLVSLFEAVVRTKNIKMLLAPQSFRNAPAYGTNFLVLSN